MTEQERGPGTFCWAELATSDPGEAKKFYSELMGWQTHDDPLPGGGTYTMLRQENGNVGALYGLNEEMLAAGVTPGWLSYVTVADARATARRAADLGGTVVKDAFDVMEIGSMALLRDPTGATFAVWQPRSSHGTDFTDGRPGSVCWNELATRDTEKAGAFYTELLGYRRKVQDMPSGPYTLFKLGEEDAAGMLGLTGDYGDLLPHWMIYLSVADCDDTVDQALELGATIKVPAMDVPAVGRSAVIQDPQGAMFSVIRLEPPAA